MTANACVLYGPPWEVANLFVTHTASQVDGTAVRLHLMRLGRDASGLTLASAMDAEIICLDRQAATLRRLRAGLVGRSLIGSGDGRGIVATMAGERIGGSVVVDGEDAVYPVARRFEFQIGIRIR